MPRYTALIIRAPSGYTHVEIDALNNHSDMVGSVVPIGYKPGDNSDGTPTRAFIYSHGKMTLLPHGPNFADHPVAINDSGMVIGFSDSGAAIQFAQSQSLGWVYSNGKLNVLPYPTNRAVTGVTSITDSGQILGWTCDADGTDSASADPNTCIWTRGKMHVISNGQPSGMDEQGNIYVQMLHPTDHTDRDCRVFKYDPSGHRKLLYLGECWAVSKHNGWVYGIKYIGRQTDPNFPERYDEIIYHNGIITKPKISVASVNSSGVLAGSLPNGSGANSYAWIQLRGHVYNLNNCVTNLPQGWSLTESVSINDRGWLIADVTYPGMDDKFPAMVVLKPVQ